MGWRAKEADKFFDLTSCRVANITYCSPNDTKKENLNLLITDLENR